MFCFPVILRHFSWVLQWSQEEQKTMLSTMQHFRGKQGVLKEICKWRIEGYNHRSRWREMEFKKLKDYSCKLK